MVSTHLKHIRQIGNLPQIGVKIKNIRNHHLAFSSKKHLSRKTNRLLGLVISIPTFGWFSYSKSVGKLYTSPGDFLWDIFEEVQISVGGGSVLFWKHCLCMFVFPLVWGRLATTIKFPWNQFTTFSAKISLDIIIFTFRKKKPLFFSRLKNHQKSSKNEPFPGSLVFQPSPPLFGGWCSKIATSTYPNRTLDWFSLFYRRLKWETIDFWGVVGAIRFGVEGGRFTNHSKTTPKPNGFDTLSLAAPWTCLLEACLWVWRCSMVLTQQKSVVFGTPENPFWRWEIPITEFLPWDGKIDQHCFFLKKMAFPWDERFFLA